MGKKPNGEVTDPQCEISEKYYYNEATLWTSHKKNMHEDKIVTSFECELCDKYFRGQISLNSHIKRVHEKKRRKLRCAVCDKNFSTTLRFWKHCQSHMK